MTEGALTEAEVQAMLPELEGWHYSGGHLRKSFRLGDFSNALGFMVRVGLECEKLDHHPNWYNCYDVVDVQLWTHRVSGVTGIDVRLAQVMNRIAAEAGANAQEP